MVEEGDGGDAPKEAKKTHDGEATLEDRVIAEDEQQSKAPSLYNLQRNPDYETANLEGGAKVTYTKHVSKGSKVVDLAKYRAAKNSRAAAKSSDSAEGIDQRAVQYKIDSGQEIDESRKKSFGNESRKEKKKTYQGAVAQIYHINPDGSAEYLLERNSLDYPYSEAQGKVRHIGGHVDWGESPLEALFREFDEEIADPTVRSILKYNLAKSQDLYAIIESPPLPDGHKVHDYVYRLEIKSDAEWEYVKNTKLRDAGEAVVMSSQQINKTTENDWAFSHGWITKKLMSDYLIAFVPPKISAIESMNYGRAPNYHVPSPNLRLAA